MDETGGREGGGGGAGEGRWKQMGSMESETRIHRDKSRNTTFRFTLHSKCRSHCTQHRQRDTRPQSLQDMAAIDANVSCEKRNAHVTYFEIFDC